MASVLACALLLMNKVHMNSPWQAEVRNLVSDTFWGAIICDEALIPKVRPTYLYIYTHSESVVLILKPSDGINKVSESCTGASPFYYILHVQANVTWSTQTSYVQQEAPPCGRKAQIIASQTRIVCNLGTVTVAFSVLGGMLGLFVLM